MQSVFFDFVRTLPPIAILPAVIVIVGVGQSLEVIIGAEHSPGHHHAAGP